jgi:uncharacterized protein YndB with AHSA1/START domain
MTDFEARSAEFTGHFTVHAPIDAVFELFSPLGEQWWVPGWSPELLHPSDVSWAQGQIFRTQEEQGEAIWLVTSLNRESHLVEYHRVEPHRYIARVRVECNARDQNTTEVSTAYAFVGLSNKGNDEIKAMTVEAYSDKMRRWKQWISDYMRRKAQTKP